MQIILMQEHHKKIMEKNFSPFEQQVGLVSLEKKKGLNAFTIQVLDAHHIEYKFDPATQKFEVHFLSVKKKISQKEEKSHGKVSSV